MKAKQREVFTTPLGTLAQDTLEKRKDNKYWVMLRLSATEAEPIIQQVEQAIEKELADINKEVDEILENGDEYEALDVEHAVATTNRPYSKQDDSSYIFTFTSKDLVWVQPIVATDYRGKSKAISTRTNWGKPPKFRTVDGKRSSKIRKPTLIKEGRRLSLVYSVVPTHRKGKVGALLSFVAADVRRQRIRVKRQ